MLMALNKIIYKLNAIVNKNFAITIINNSFEAMKHDL